MRSIKLASAATALAAATSLALAMPASALDADAQSGVNSVCGSIDWDAQTTMNMANEHYSNTGYNTAVSADLGDTEGIFMLTHFTLGDIKGTDENGAATYTDGANTVQVWRPGIATTEAIKGATFTITLPEGVQGVTFGTPKDTDEALNTYVQGWGGEWANYTWKTIDLANATDNGDGTATVNLGDLDANTGVMFEVKATYEDGTDLGQDYVASAKLTGTTDEECPLPGSSISSGSSTSSLGWIGKITEFFNSLLRLLGINA